MKASSVLAIAALAALARPALPQAPSARAVVPVLAFPEPGLDDTAAYQGYKTRFWRDSKQNVVQVYLEARGGRVVNLWADAADESVGFTVRDARGAPASLRWGADTAEVSDSGATRTIAYRLAASAPRIEIGWFLLGSMRVERDFQYAHAHLKPFTPSSFRVAEESLLVSDVARLPAAERARHLTLLGARDVSQLRARLVPTITSSRTEARARVRIARPSLDGRNHLTLELIVDPRDADIRAGTSTVTIAARAGAPVRFTVRVSTDAAALTPLTREEMFNRPFLDFLAQARAAGTDSASVMRARRLEREVRGVELLSSREKLMAGLPNFATYFGRDMLMTALMMRPVWNPAMSEYAIASALRKLGPHGDVSHEEALGGQAIRENATEYHRLVGDAARCAPRPRAVCADTLLASARALLRDLQRIRENYFMMDDEFQLPVLEASWLADTSVSAEHKRAFLLERSESGATRLALVLRELALVAQETEAYVREPVATNLVSFVKRDSTHWRSASWRDSDAGYANGRFAMDINAIWAPRALESMATILSSLQTLGIGGATLDSVAPSLAAYARDGASLRRAIQTWKTARRHFAVTLDPRTARERIDAKLGSLPANERRHWDAVLAASGEVRDSVHFLALSLDSAGRPIPVVNTDPSTELFLEEFTGGNRGGFLAPELVLHDVEPFVRPYPVGLFVEGLGPLVANDAYASPRIWSVFERDQYHSPRVVWGREVNLFFLGVANQLAGIEGDQSRSPEAERFARTLEDALRRTLDAVHASGLEHNELWSYRFVGDSLVPTRYGTSSDVQLWNGTDLAVQFVLARRARK